MVGLYWVLLNILFVTLAQNADNCPAGQQGGDETRKVAVQNGSLYDVISPLLDASTFVFPIARMRHVARQRIMGLLSRKKNDLVASDFVPYVPSFNDSEALQIIRKVQETRHDDEHGQQVNVRELISLEQREILTSNELDQLEDMANVLRLPKSPPSALADFEKFFANDTSFRAFMYPFGGVEFFHDALRYLAEQHKDDRVLVEFDDDFTELGLLVDEAVFGILIFKDLQKIILVFRGSKTASDWATNVLTTMKTFSNPHSDVDGQAAECGIHEGFHDYLFATSSNRGSKHDRASSKLKELLKEYPNYQVHMTGHSLGGALSTLFAVKASLDPDIPKPVIVVTFGSPYVGDERFLRLCQLLEGRGQLRILRIANNDDIVPLLPPALITSATSLVSYRHVGISLVLFRDRWFRQNPKPKILFTETEINEDELDKTMSGRVIKRVRKFLNEDTPAPLFHIVREYRNRFEAGADYLRNLAGLEGLYNDPNVVRDLEEKAA